MRRNHLQLVAIHNHMCVHYFVHKVHTYYVRVGVQRVGTNELVCSIEWFDLLAEMEKG